MPQTYNSRISHSVSEIDPTIEDLTVQFTGENIPASISSFHESILIDKILNNVNYSTPTPIQKFIIPIALEKRDFMACAQTGSGKTAAFLLPILNSVLSEENLMWKRDFRRLSPFALILAPTRELVIQIHDDAVIFANNTQISIEVVYGGTQQRLPCTQCHVLVATPGRLIDLYGRGKVEFKHVKYLVLDEADRMLDMGFEPQIREILEKTNMPNVLSRQTMMFSATFAQNIQVLARHFLKSDYIFLNVGRIGSTSANIRQYLEWAENGEKKSYLLDVLDRYPGDLTLIFVETKQSADELERFLLNHNYPAVSIHGDKVQYEREEALSAFKSGQTWILVATAVAARGLDVPNVKLVVNYDLPKNIDEYVHRIGRTGRAGKHGTSISFFNDKNLNIARGLCDKLSEANQDVPDFLTKILGESRANVIGQVLNKKQEFKYKSSAVEFDKQLKKNNFVLKKDNNTLCPMPLKANINEIDWFDHD